MEEQIETKPTNGQLFKQKNGYSKTMKRLMNKHNCANIYEYRKLRLKNRK